MADVNQMEYPYTIGPKDDGLGKPPIPPSEVDTSTWSPQRRELEDIRRERQEIKLAEEAARAALLTARSAPRAGLISSFSQWLSRVFRHRTPIPQSGAS